MKGKGELYVRPTSYEQDGDAKRGLPDIIQSTVNNGVDPSLIPLEGEGEQELVEGSVALLGSGHLERDSWEREQGKGSWESYCYGNF